MSRDPIDESKLDFDIISDISELSIVDHNVKDEMDTLEVRKFLKENAGVYYGNNLTSIWKVIYEKTTTIGFFTISMNSMAANDIPKDNKVDEMKGRYPAILLDRCGYDLILEVEMHLIGSANM